MEQLIMEWIYQFRSPFLTELMLIVTLFGKEVALLLFFLFTARLYFKGGVKSSLRYILAVITGLLINVVFLKAMIARERPSFIEHLVYESDFSFPSGHTMGILIVSLVFVIVNYQVNRNKRTLVVGLIITYLMTFLVGLSRVYLGVHYPTDILGSILIGTIYCLIFALTHRRRQLSKSL